MKVRSWTDDQLRKAVANSKSYRSVLIVLGLVPAGCNYEQIKRRVFELALRTEHFTGKGWNVGLGFQPNPPQLLEKLLVKNS